MSETNASKLKILIEDSDNRLLLISKEIEQLALEVDNRSNVLMEAGRKIQEEREFNEYLKTLLNHNKRGTN